MRHSGSSWCNMLVLLYTAKEKLFKTKFHCIISVWLPFILEADFYNDNHPLDWIDFSDTKVMGVSSDGAAALMHRMFSVYICIPWWLYLLLTTANELICHAAALLSLTWKRVCVKNLGGCAHSLFICIEPTCRQQQHVRCKISIQVLLLCFWFVTVPWLKKWGDVMVRMCKGRCGCDYAAKEWWSYYHLSCSKTRFLQWDWIHILCW